VRLITCLLIITCYMFLYNIVCTPMIPQTFLVQQRADNANANEPGRQPTRTEEVTSLMQDTGKGHRRQRRLTPEQSILLTQIHLQEQEVEAITKRKAACYAMVTGIVSAILTAAVTIGVHFSNCPPR